MKHLCIINPMAGAVSGHVDELVEEIRDFFSRNPRMEYSIHITRWKRDASGYVLRYVKNSKEIIRVYAFGGGGTLFEVINGVMGLPNVNVAYFPLGRDNDLISAFGKNSRAVFRSIGNLFLSPVTTIDTILAGNHYVVSNIAIGVGAVSYLAGISLSERLMLPVNVSYNLANFFYIFTKTEIHHYVIEMEGLILDDDYAGIFIANISGKSGGNPAVEARFNNGYIDMYTLKTIPRKLIIKVLMDYQKGLYAKWPQYLQHYRCKKLKITSATDMTITLDGEAFYNTELSLEIQPFSLNIVCPSEIDRTLLVPPVEIVQKEEFAIQELLHDEETS